MRSILVVDDELSIRESFSLILEGRYQLRLAASGEAALKAAADQKLDLVYLDIRMPGMDGLETLKKIKALDPDLEVIMVTAVNDVQKATEAIKHGARDYLVKPFDVERILKLTEQTLRKKSLFSAGSRAQKQSGRDPLELIGQNDKILEIKKTAAKLKGSERVLILGEAGTEKELLARVIHEQSGRGDGPFLAAHLSTQLSAPQIKNLLFGRGQGSSTAELTGQSGLFELAKEGSLLLNNLSLLPAEVFKTISSLRFSRSVDSAAIPIECRLIGGATPDLAETDKAVFDFFSEVHLHLPPLRERASDVPLLANHYFQRFNAQYNRELTIDQAVFDSLSNYIWPGNTLQLEGLMERLVLSCLKGRIEVEDLPIEVLLAGRGSAGSEFVSNFEKEYIQAVFEQSGKNKEKAATLLGISPFLLETKL